MREMNYNGWLILGFGSGAWTAKKQSFPFTTLHSESLEELQAEIDNA